MLDYGWLRQEFGKRFAGEARVFRAPGRVNLIGEHTDYNDGFVFPVAMDREVAYAVRPTADRSCHLYALDLGKEEQFSLDAMSWTPSGHWTNYIKAMAKALEEAGYPCYGFEGVIAGDVPIEGGVSSSSAITVAAAMTYEGLAPWECEPTKLVKLTQIAENSATGLRGGIMDQFTSRLAQRDHALLIDCRTFDYTLVPMPPMTLVVADTRKPRSLATTAYNERRAQCEEGAKTIARRYGGVTHLRDVTTAMLEACRGDLSEVVYRRCRHVVSENARTLECVDILKQGDLPALGQRINASHVSLRDDYEVSCDELNSIVEIAWDTPGVYGARMVGGGFGGCAMAVCEPPAVEILQRRVAAEYNPRYNLVADVYATRSGDGAGEVLAG
ncbi:MAG: galactokinase [Fimbriimonadaceae bacterium]|nr:galactokinase [Fimbriimonadaceae bacterium]